MILKPIHDNDLKILNRRGKIRIDVKESINFSDQNIYFYNNKFSTIDTRPSISTSIRF